MRRSLRLAGVTLATALVAGCTTQVVTPNVSGPSIQEQSPKGAMPSHGRIEHAALPDPRSVKGAMPSPGFAVLPVPKAVIGLWRGDTFFGHAVGNRLPPYMSFDPPAATSRLSTRVLADGAYSDECNQGQTVSAFGPHHRIRFLVASGPGPGCPPSAFKLNDALFQARTWEVKRWRGTTMLLTFYDSQHQPTAVFDLLINTPSSPAVPPKALVGYWKATDVEGYQPPSTTRAGVSFVAPGSPFFYFGAPGPSNGGMSDGCNGGSFNATFGPDNSINIQPGFQTAMACQDLNPVRQALSLAHTWNVTVRGKTSVLTLYDKSHNVEARFVSEPAGRK